MQRIVLQLDYYAGGQFAGVFTALRRGLFAKRGLDVHILPPPTPGGEAAAVFQAQSLNTSALVLGSCEQNALLAWPTPEIVAIGAMLPRSPLALLSLSSDAPLKRLGAHADTVDVLKATLPGCKVELLGRADEAARFQKLLDGSLDAIQVYHTTEPLSLRQLGPRGKSAQMRPLCASADGGVGALDLGYAQSIFGVDAAVSDHASAARAFLEVLHDGWRLAAEDVLLAAEDISAFSAFESEEAMFGGVKRTDLNFHAACAARCAPAAVAMPPHMFDAQRWEKVDDGLLAALKPSTAWAHTPAKSLFEKTTATTKTAASFDGLAVARQLRADARHRAEAVLHERARRPRLAIVRVGDAEGALGGLDRAQAFPASSTPRGVESWYAKKRLLESDGIQVTYASLPAGSSASAVIDAVKRASNDARNDGVLLERPLVGCSYEVTATMLQGVLDVSKDVDAELGGPTKPLTVEGVLHALDALDLDNSKASRKWCGLFDDDASSAPSSILAGGADVVVVGRSAKLGLPLAKALISRDATVTVVHSQTRAITLANAVKSADVVFSCAGSPGLITASMLKEGSVVFNVGTKYDAPTKTLSADAADDVASVARLLTPTPHGIGPLCTAVLARRVVRRAEERALKIPDGLPASWAVLEKNASTCATRSVSFPSLSAAVEALKAVSAVGDSLGHHPTANLNEAQACEQVHGCVLRLSLTTFSKGKRLTPLDVKAAVAIDAALEAVQRRPALDVQKLDYHLPDERIARYPASPRGSSKLLHRSADGVLKDYRFDTDLVNTLPKDAILVVNESRVVHGRVAAKLDGSTLEAFEVMLLNPAAKGDSAYPADAVSSKADGQTWLAMIRRAATKKGDVLHVAAGVSLTVEGVVGQWIEEGEKDGVEALVRFHVAENETMDAVLQKVGEVPLPPYLRRAPDDSDTTAYQTAYAQEAGSVAAPTAGLHFTPKVLEAVRASGRTIVAVALHVGAGTFKPLTSPNLADHDMHAEHFSIKKTALTQLRDAALQNRPIVAVGTTAARALESLAALSRCSNGVQSGKVCSLGHLKQWQAYDDASTSTAGLSAASAFDAVLDAAGGCDEVRASTSLCIAPGFQFQIVDSLVTNFHHPDSTLVALVAALVGGEGETHSLYSHALEKDYRFLSYGDACLLDNPAAASKQRRGD